MKLFMLLAATAALGTVALSGSASAQDYDFGDGPPPPHYHHHWGWGFPPPPPPFGWHRPRPYWANDDRDARAPWRGEGRNSFRDWNRAPPPPPPPFGDQGDEVSQD